MTNNTTNNSRLQQRSNITDPRWPPGRRRSPITSHRTDLCVQTCQNLSSNVPTQMLTIIIFSMLVMKTKAICPSKCVCNDKVLEVSCVSSNLEVVPIQLNPEIKKLSLNQNRIASIHLTLTFYTNLQRLDMSYNKIKNFGSKNFELQNHLRYLNVSYNLVPRLHKDCFKGLHNLRILDLSYNLIEEIHDKSGLNDLSSLQDLYLSHNRLLSLDITVPLSSVELDHNQILNIPSFGNVNEVNLGFNLIEVIDNNLPNTLSKLILNSNLINDINNHSFNHLINLTYLDLSDNNLTSIPSFQLSKLINLRFLNLSSNFFSSLKPLSFHGLFKLNELFLDNLPLVRIDPRSFIDNINLNVVSISNNIYLNKLPHRLFKSNFNLKHLKLFGNGFTTLYEMDLNLDQIETLSIAHNPFTCNCSLLWLLLVKDRNVTCDQCREEYPVILDINDVTCHLPKHLKNRKFRSVEKSDLDCDSTWYIALFTCLAILFVILISILVYILKTCNNPNKNNVDQYIEATKTYEDMNRTYYKANVLDIVSDQKTTNMYISRPVLKDLRTFGSKEDERSESSGCSFDTVNDVHIYQEPFAVPVPNRRSPHIVYV